MSAMAIQIELAHAESCPRDSHPLTSGKGLYLGQQMQRFAQRVRVLRAMQRDVGADELALLARRLDRRVAVVRKRPGESL